MDTLLTSVIAALNNKQNINIYVTNNSYKIVTDNNTLTIHDNTKEHNSPITLVTKFTVVDDNRELYREVNHGFVLEKNTSGYKVIGKSKTKINNTIDPLTSDDKEILHNIGLFFE